MSDQKLLDSKELKKFEQETDTLDPSKPHTGLTTTLHVISIAHKLVFHVNEVPTSGDGPGPIKGDGDFNGPPIPKLGPSEDRVYSLKIRGYRASLSLGIDGGHGLVFRGEYTGVQRLNELDGDWTGSWRQP